jgi:hypothetical protein
MRRRSCDVVMSVVRHAQRKYPLFIQRNILEESALREQARG